MTDLINELNEKSTLLSRAVNQLKARGVTYAEADRDYRVALQKKMTIERAGGMPVTILSDICRGDEEIAKYRCRRDIAESEYRSALEAINALKIQIKLLDNQIEREWKSG